MSNASRRRGLSSLLAGVLGVSAMLGAASLPGCATYAPGGSGFSNDTYTYYSTPHEPKNIVIVDTRTGERFWMYEIPAGRQLVVRFYEDQYRDNAYTPAAMRWQEMPIGQKYGTLSNVMAVPDAGCRRVDLDVRPGPEMPTTTADTIIQPPETSAGESY